jgi:hypothetical protein
MNPSSGTDSVLNYSRLAWFIIGLAAVIQLSRILGITAPHGELPFLSANDRSRWCAIAALTEDGAWEIDKYIELLDSKGKSKIWNTIDMVKHLGPDGREHSYSSKPPLLTLLYAAICKPITMIADKKLTEEPFLIGRWVLVIANGVPLVLWWIWWHRWLEKNVANALARWYMLNIAVWGTFLTTFTATLNNHLHGAIFFCISLALAWQVLRDARAGYTTSWGVWLSIGISAAMTVACELPALAWAVALGAILFVADPKRMLVGFGIGSAMIAVAFLASNFWAHGDWRPPYSHRGLGNEIAQMQDLAQDTPPTLDKVIAALDVTKHPITAAAQIIPARLEGVLQVVDESTQYRVAVTNKDGIWRIHQWDDWYDYPKSYWLPENKKGVDRGESNRWNYLLQFTIGHHGILSLTPFWLWAIAGAGCWAMSGSNSLKKSASDESKQDGLQDQELSRWRGWLLSDRGISLAIIAVSLACIVFYASRDQVDRNYAGVCSGFRWMFWLIPGWLWLSVPAVQWSVRHRTVHFLLLVAIALSVLSATIAWPNPWSHPWPYRLLMWWSPQNYQ